MEQTESLFERQKSLSQSEITQKLKFRCHVQKHMQLDSVLSQITSVHI